MKKFTLFTLSLICVLFVTSCSDDANDSYGDATILVSKKAIEYDKGGGSETFTVTVNKKNDFIAQSENPVDWAKISTNGDEVTVTVKPNKTASTRTAKILVFTLNGGLKRYVDISQTATDLVFDTTPTKVQFTRFGGEKEVRITTNTTDWTVEGGADWFKIEDDKFFGIIRLTAIQNELDDERTAVITIKSGTEERKIEVIQKGGAELILPYQNFKAFISEVIKFEVDRGHVYKFIPKTPGYAENHVFMTNSYLMPRMFIDYTRGLYAGAVVENSIPKENIEEINEFHKNYSALLVENGYGKKTDTEYRMSTEDIETDISATIYTDGVIFGFFYKQTAPMPTFDKFPYGFMSWGANRDEVDAYEASVGGTIETSEGYTLKYIAGNNDPDASYRMYFFSAREYSNLSQIEIGIKDYSKMVYIGKDGKPHETEEFAALLEKENFTYLYRDETSTTIMYLRPSPKGGSWVTACAIRMWMKENVATINLWDEEYNPSGVSSFSYIEGFKARVEDRIKRADKAAQNRGILR